MRPIFEIMVRFNWVSSANHKYFWIDDVLAITHDESNDVVYTHNNIGLVHLPEDGGGTHTLYGVDPDQPVARYPLAIPQTADLHDLDTQSVRVKS